MLPSSAGGNGLFSPGNGAGGEIKLDQARRNTASARPDCRHLLFIPLIIVILDQILKTVMVQWIGPQSDTHRWELAGRLLAFEYLENRGAAFGILPGKTELLTAISIMLSGFGIAMMWRELNKHPLTAVAIGMVVGGAIGNVIDRIRLGYVVDFIAVGVWPKFNLADAAITVGVVLLLWSAIDDERAAMPGNQGVKTDG